MIERSSQIELPLGVRLNPHHPSARGLIGAWWFNEGGGRRAHDLSGLGNDGFMTSQQAWRACPYGHAAVFDGVAEYVDLGARPSLSRGSHLTVMARWKTAGDYTTRGAFIANSDAGAGDSNFAFTFGFTDNKIEWWNNVGGPNLASATSISTDEWRTVAATRLGAGASWNLKIYIDGVLDASGTTAQAPSGTQTTPTSIGRLGAFNGYYLKGQLDHLLFWSRALPHSEIWSMTRNPYQILVPPEVWAIQVGGGVITPDMWLNQSQFKRSLSIPVGY